MRTPLCFGYQFGSFRVHLREQRNLACNVVFIAANLDREVTVDVIYSAMRGHKHAARVNADGNYWRYCLDTLSECHQLTAMQITITAIYSTIATANMLSVMRGIPLRLRACYVTASNSDPR